MASNETIVVNLSDYAGGRVQIHATQSAANPTHWDISICTMERVWLADGKYVAEYARGIEDCDANFSETDYRLMDEALGLMAKGLSQHETRIYKVTTNQSNAGEIASAYAATEGRSCRNADGVFWLTCKSWPDRGTDFDELENAFGDDDRILEFEVVQ